MRAPSKEAVVSLHISAAKRTLSFPSLILCLSNRDNTADFLSNSLMLEKPLARFVPASSARRQAGRQQQWCLHQCCWYLMKRQTLPKSSCSTSGPKYRKSLMLLFCFPSHTPHSFQHITLLLVSCGAWRPCLSFFLWKIILETACPGQK